MAVEIEELILAPFREVVDRGKDAVTNAEAAIEDDADDETAKRMAKAGKAIVREGERALRRLQPLWDGQVEKYGDMFKTAMSKNNEIEDKRHKLEDLLYDFEDFVELEGFDEERFTQLQAAVKSLALFVLDTIKRLKLDGVPVGPPPKAVSAFPPLPPLPSAVLLQAAAKSPSRSPILNHMSKPPLRPSSRGRDTPNQDGAEHPPRPQRMPSAVSNSSNDSRRRLTPQGVSRRDTTISHASSHYSVDSLPPYSSEEVPLVPQLSVFPLAVQGRIGDNQQPAHSQQAQAQAQAQPHPVDRTPAAHRPAQRPGSTLDVLPVSSQGGSMNPPARPPKEPTSPDSTGPLEIPVFPISRTTAWVTGQSAVPASPRVSTRPLPIRESVIPEGQAVTSSPTVLALELNSSHFNHPRSPPAVLPPDGGDRAPSRASVTPAMPPPSLPSAAAELESGLMVSEDWKTVISDGTNAGSRALMSVSSGEPDCSIGPKSSLYQMKGFCEGAQAFKQGGHLQGVKKMQGYVAGATTFTAKCISCGYAHQYDELSMDVHGNSKANFFSSNVRFRVRFLYKSHLPKTSERMPEGYYGCLFCAQTGSVVREGDATVFATSDDLFRHLARHPQPLPEVPNVTVLYGKDFGPEDTARLNDFDVHFIEPPITGPEAGGMPPTADLARLPVATATKMHVQRYGEKKLPRPAGFGADKNLLEFFVGACIVGIEFPTSWDGKWATGWHDGRWGAFPTKNVELEQPRRSAMPPLMTQASGGTAVSVVARWKWEPRTADKGWLVFDKGDTITNVGWIFNEHWCWSGTNRKGQLGVFPRSHVRWDKVKEEVVLPIGSPVARPTTSKGLTKTTTKRGFFGRSKTVASSASSTMSGTSSVIEIVI